MRLFLSLSAFLISAALAVSAGLPLTTKQVSLMLRSGYSSETVMHELANHHFGDTFDPAVEKQLQKAGASPVLLDALRKGSFQASESEIVAAEQKLAEQEELAAGTQTASPPKAVTSKANQRPNSLPATNT